MGEEGVRAVPERPCGGIAPSPAAVRASAGLRAAGVVPQAVRMVHGDGPAASSHVSPAGGQGFGRQAEQHAPA